MKDAGLEYFADTDPERPAVVDPSGRTWTCGALSAFSNRFARALHAAGMRPGDALAIMAPNSAEFLAANFAATRAGLYLVLINWHLSAAEIAYILRDSGAKAVLVHPRQARIAQAALEQSDPAPALRLSIGAQPGYIALEDFMAGCSDEPFATGVLGRPMIYTSATTGLPKAILLSLADSQLAHERVMQAHAAFDAAAGIAVGDRSAHLCTSMLYHTTPLECAAMAVNLGHCAILMDRWEPQSALRLIEQHRVQSSMMVPSMFVRLLKLPEEVRARYSTASLKFVSHGCAPCAAEIKKQMIAWWGPIFWEMYGASEGSGTCVGPADWLRFPGTVGRPFPGAAVKILDEEGNELPRGTVGTIYLKRFTGDRFEYRGDPEKTRAAHVGDFFTAGDIGYLNEEGFLFISDRKIDMIISGGVNIYSAEIERVLVGHPQVADCAVLGVPDAVLGEAVKAVIEPTAGATPGPALSADIMAFLFERISSVKLPRRIEYVERIPRDPNGKLFKRRLRESSAGSAGA